MAIGRIDDRPHGYWTNWLLDEMVIGRNGHWTKWLLDQMAIGRNVVGLTGYWTKRQLDQMIIGRIGNGRNDVGRNVNLPFKCPIFRKG